MKQPSSSSVLLFLALSVIFFSDNCHATLSGDEPYTAIEGGRFWVFHTAGLSIVDPEQCRIHRDVRSDTEANFLPDEWADGVYLETTTRSDGSKDGYIYINSGVTNYDRNDNPQGEVIVFDTATESVLSRLPIEGGSHYHSYGIPTRNEYWTLGNGKLNMFPVGSTDSATITQFGLESNNNNNNNTVNGGIDNDDEDGIHGQIMWNEHPYLSHFGYITSSGPELYIVDLDTKQRVSTFNYSSYVNEGECSRGGYGRGMAFASSNKHLFVECGWQGPILEFDLSQAPTIPHFVAKHNMSGWLYEYNDETLSGQSYVIATDRHADKVHILQVAPESGQAASKEYEIDVPGHPDEASFYTTHKISAIPYSQHGGADNHNQEVQTIVCMPLTENVNSNDRFPDNGTVACDVYSCGPPQSPEDVAAGMCLYDSDNDDWWSRNKTLLRAPLADYDKVVNGEAPYFNRCPRCKELESYSGGDICTCTPHCGSCGTPSYDREILSQTGVRCFDLQAALANANKENNGVSSSYTFTTVPSTFTTSTTLIGGAGAVEQEPASFWGAPCSYGWTHRSSKRGGRYHASVAHIPSNSLQIVDMATETFRCAVDLPGKPDRVLYVPPQESFNEEESQLWQRSLMIVLVVFGVSAITVGIAVATTRRRGARYYGDGANKNYYENEIVTVELELEEQPGSGSHLPELTRRDPFMTWHSMEQPSRDNLPEMT